MSYGKGRLSPEAKVWIHKMATRIKAINPHRTYPVCFEIARQEYKIRRKEFINIHGRNIWLNGKFRFLEEKKQFNNDYMRRLMEQLKPAVESKLCISGCGNLSDPGEEFCCHCSLQIESYVFSSGGV